MTIDAKELREAINFCRADVARAVGIDLVTVSVSRLAAVVEAASAHLASLPREVEIERWVVLDATGDVCGICLSEDAARSFVTKVGDQVVRLTGTALLPPQKD